MSSVESSDVGTPIYDQLEAEIWPPERPAPRTPGDPVVGQQD